MDPHFWGPALWRSIHSICATYTPDKREGFLQFIYSLPVVIPCDSCSKHLTQNLKDFPPTNYLQNNHQLFLWSYSLHDMVNKQLHKPQSPPFQSVKQHYFNPKRCKSCSQYH